MHGWLFVLNLNSYGGYVTSACRQWMFIHMYINHNKSILKGGQSHNNNRLSQISFKCYNDIGNRHKQMSLSITYAGHNYYIVFRTIC